MDYGIDYPSIDELLSKYGSKYKIAYISAIIAQKIIKENITFSSDYKNTSPIGLALEEMLRDRVLVYFETK